MHSFSPFFCQNLYVGYTLLERCLKNYTTLCNIWTYQLLYKKILHILCKILHKLCNILTQQLVGSYVTQRCVFFKQQFNSVGLCVTHVQRNF